MYYVNAQGVDEHAINLHYCYLSTHVLRKLQALVYDILPWRKMPEAMIGVCAWFCVAYTIQESCTSSSYSVT